MKRSFKKFEERLELAGLRTPLEKRLRGVSLRELYEGNKEPAFVAARREAYLWLMSKGKRNNEIARLFDRARSNVSVAVRRGT